MGPQHGSLLQKLVAGFKCHLLQRGGVGLDSKAVEGLVHALKCHVICHQGQVPRVYLNTIDRKDIFDLLLDDSQCHLYAICVGHGGDLIGIQPVQVQNLTVSEKLPAG
uniref:Uncharacterized protein n=1 Tax=Anguilla anguilla TaxID=7936 RepID=A0A0E9TVP0_ANGAN